MDEKKKSDWGGAASSPRPGTDAVRLSSRRRQPNTTHGSPKSVLDHNGVPGAIKVELSDSQDESVPATSSNVVPVVLPKKVISPKKISGKRPIINVDAHYSSDEEEFAGFGEQNGSGEFDCVLSLDIYLYIQYTLFWYYFAELGNRRKKIKEEPLSDIESVGERQVKIEAEVKQEQDTEVC